MCLRVTSRSCIVLCALSHAHAVRISESENKEQIRTLVFLKTAVLVSRSLETEILRSCSIALEALASAVFQTDQ